MGNATPAATGQMTCAVDFGSGRQADIELREPEPLWVTVGPGIAGADIWMKAAANSIDLRVRIQRAADGLHITIDRGEQSAAWWPADAVPRLSVVIDEAAGVAAASASVGAGREFQEVLLGETRI